MADIYVATTGNDATGNGSSGNPYATPGKAGSVMSGGDRVLIKYNSTASAYDPTNGNPNAAGGYLDPPAGTAAAPSQVIGYNSTVGDLDDINNWSNFPILRGSASGNTTILRMSNNYTVVRNISFDANSNAGYCLYAPGGQGHVANCKMVGGSSYGLYLSATNSNARRCYVTGAATGIAIGTTCTIEACVVTACTALGISGGGTGGRIIRCLIHGNSGASTDGLLIDVYEGYVISNCVFYNNGRDGVRFNVANYAFSAVVRNCIFTNNTGYGINAVTTTYNVLPGFDYNFFKSNSGGQRPAGVPAGAHDIDLTADPFTNAAGGDFSLNNTAGGGAAVRAAGYPGVFPGGLTTGYLDGGPVQHQDSASTNLFNFIKRSNTIMKM